MNLIEALKSGRPIKKESWGDTGWLTVQDKVLVNEIGTVFTIWIDDVAADDWAIKPKEPKLLFGYAVERTPNKWFYDEGSGNSFSPDGVRLIDVRVILNLIEGLYVCRALENIETVRTKLASLTNEAFSRLDTQTNVKLPKHGENIDD